MRVGVNYLRGIPSYQLVYHATSFVSFWNTELNNDGGKKSIYENVNRYSRATKTGVGTHKELSF
jgi:hypothetical protein